MNLTNLKKEPVPVALGGGLLGLLLRGLLYRIGFDEKGILPASHPLHLACLVLTVVVLGYLALRALGAEEKQRELPPVRLCLGLASGCFLLLHSLTLLRTLWVPPVLRISGILPLLHWVLTAGAAIAMVVCVLLPKHFRNGSAVCHGIVCAAFAADMLGRYRAWSGNPQLPDYVFHVLAGVSLSLCTYQTLALHTGLGNTRLHRFFCTVGLFLCLLCLAGPEPRTFYLGGGLWSVVCLLTVLSPEEETDVPA